MHLQVETNIAFMPGVYTKCTRAIESCVLIEQLKVANTMVENNYNNLTEAQYVTLKAKVARHPCAANLVMVPAHSKGAIFIHKYALVGAVAIGVLFWITFGVVMYDHFS